MVCCGENCITSSRLLTLVCPFQLPVVASSHLVGYLHLHLCPCYLASAFGQEQERCFWRLLEICPYW
ncbi:hypothetical protein SBP28_004625 [Candidozyma auris]